MDPRRFLLTHREVFMKSTRMFHPRLFVGLVLAVIVLSLPVVALAQETRSTILGTVKDPSGAVVPGAKVKITNRATNQSREATTNPEGA